MLQSLKNINLRVIETWISFSYNEGSSDGGSDASLLVALDSGSNCINTEVTVDVFNIHITSVTNLTTLHLTYIYIYIYIFSSN